MTDSNGVVTRYEYDLLNRLAAVVENLDAGGPADHQTNVRTEYTYDENGNRLTIRDGNGHVTTFTYDGINRLSTEADALGNTTSYAYDAVGNRTALTDANGFTTNFTYDAANRLIGIDYPAPDPDVSFTYDPAGNRVINGETLHVSGPNADGGFERTDHGYATLGTPWQQHSLRWGDNDPSGNTPNEDFADMFLNWAYGSLTDDPAGRARQDFMDNHMADWVTYAREPYQDSWLGNEP